MKEIRIQTPYIQLDQLLKFEGIVPSGGQAKEWIRQGDIWVNGEPCTVVRKKIYAGDRIDILDEGTFVVTQDED